MVHLGGGDGGWTESTVPVNAGRVTWSHFGCRR